MTEITIIAKDTEFICTQNKKFVDIYHDDKYVGHIIDSVPDLDCPYTDFIEFEKRITDFVTLVFFAHSDPIEKEKFNEIKTNLIKY